MARMGHEILVEADRCLSMNVDRHLNAKNPEPAADRSQNNKSEISDMPWRRERISVLAVARTPQNTAAFRYASRQELVAPSQAKRNPKVKSGTAARTIRAVTS
jgi:hypothetical protein